MSAAVLTTLPPELVTQIIELLNYKDVLRCRLVSRMYRDLVDSCSAVQYKIQLAISGMSDNPGHTMPVPEKLSLLKDYTMAWTELPADKLDASRQSIPLQDGPAWELAGGMLAQSIGSDRIEFRQLPSRLRGVEAETWTTTLECQIRDFTMDPGQDLLVVVEVVSFDQSEGSVHLLSMRTGRDHPLARQVKFHYPCRGRFSTSFEIRINGRYVGLLAVNPRAMETEVTIWDWLSGTKIYHDTGTYLTSFVFVGDCHVLIAKDESESADSPTESVGMYLVNLAAQTQRWKFSMPPLVIPDAVQAVELLCEPGASWRPSEALAVPFYVSHDERVIVLNMGVSPFTSISFAFLSSSLLSIAQDAGASDEGYKEIVWREWGFHQCSAYITTQWDGIWPCVIYGTKYVSMRIMTKEQGYAYHTIVVRDFNQLSVRRTLGRHDERPTSSEVCTGELTLDSNIVGMEAFEEPIRTCLPYREVAVPCRLTYRDYIMISEDSIVIVKNSSNHNEPTEFQVYSL